MNFEKVDDLVGTQVQVEFDDATVDFEIVDTFAFNEKNYAFMVESGDMENLEEAIEETEDGEPVIVGNGYLMIIKPDFTLAPIEEDGEFFAAIEYYQALSFAEEEMEEEDEDEEYVEDYDDFEDDDDDFEDSED